MKHISLSFGILRSYSEIGEFFWEFQRLFMDEYYYASNGPFWEMIFLVLVNIILFFIFSVGALGAICYIAPIRHK